MTALEAADTSLVHRRQPPDCPGSSAPFLPSIPNMTSTLSADGGLAPSGNHNTYQETLIPEIGNQLVQDSTAMHPESGANPSELSNIPLEIRREIWKLLLPGPRSFTATTKRDRNGRLLFHFLQKEKQPILSQICAETRDFLLEHWSFISDDSHRGGGFWWNSQSDKMIFDSSWSPSVAHEVLSTLHRLHNVHNISIYKNHIPTSKLDHSVTRRLPWDGTNVPDDLITMHLGFYRDPPHLLHFIRRFFPTIQTLAIMDDIWRPATFTLMSDEEYKSGEMVHFMCSFDPSSHNRRQAVLLQRGPWAGETQSTWRP